MTKSLQIMNFVWIVLSVSFFLVVVSSLHANAESCANKCADAGYGDSSCQGTAPLCNGSCSDAWYGQKVDDIGECTDGSSCWSGSKRCCCRKFIDYKSTSKSMGYDYFQCTRAPYSAADPWPMAGWCDSDFICICTTGVDGGPSWDTESACGGDDNCI